MSFWWRPTGLLLLVIMVLMALQVALKKPYCIDSHIVHKIDIVNSQLLAQPKHQIFSCDQFKPAQGWSGFNVDLLSARLGKLQLVLSRLGLKNQFSVLLDQSKTSYLKWQGTQLQISEDLLYTQKFEAELLQKSLLQTKFPNSVLTAELMADLILSNKKSLNAYTQTWFYTLDQLGGLQEFKTKMQIIKALAQMPQQQKSDDPIQLIEMIFQNDSLPLSYFLKNLEKRGLKWSDQDFDLIVHSLDLNRNDLVQISQLASENNQLKIAYVDVTGFYVLPYLTKLNSKQQSKAKAQWRLLLLNQQAENIQLLKYVNNTNKLVLMKVPQDHQQQINFNPLFKGSMNSFLVANKKLDFIQFHMESFQFRSQYLNQINDLFSWLKEARYSADKIKALGWQSQFWSLELQAYKPVAVYDVIQSFRIN